MTSRQNQKRGGREREKERKGASKSREFILTAFDSSSHKERGEQAPARGADTSVGEKTLLDKSHYSLLPFTTGRLYQKKGAAVVIPFRAKNAYSAAGAEKMLTSTGEAVFPPQTQPERKHQRDDFTSYFRNWSFHAL